MRVSFLIVFTHCLFIHSCKSLTALNSQIPPEKLQPFLCTRSYPPFSKGSIFRLSWPAQCRTAARLAAYHPARGAPCANLKSHQAALVCPTSFCGLVNVLGGEGKASQFDGCQAIPNERLKVLTALAARSEPGRQKICLIMKMKRSGRLEIS